MLPASCPSKGARFFEGRVPIPCAPFDIACSLRVGGRYDPQTLCNCKNANEANTRFNRESQIPDGKVPWFISLEMRRVSSFALTGREPISPRVSRSRLGYPSPTARSRRGTRAC
jgi:hypothetical protein